MKKFAAIILTLAIFITSMASCSAKSDWEYIKSNKTLKIGYTLFEPMNYKDDNGKLIGFDTEFAEAVCSELGLKPEFIIINWDTKEIELNSKNIDCIWNGFTVNDERKENVDFSTPYVVNKQVVIIRKSDADKYKSLSDMANATCAAESKSAGETAIKSDSVLSANTYHAMDKQTDVLLEVKSGTSNIGVIDYVMAKSMIANGTDYSDLMIVESVQLTPEEYAIGFRKNSPETLEKINSTINTLSKNGKLAKIAEKYDLTEQLADSLK